MYSEETIRLNMAFLVRLTQLMGEMGKDKVEKINANRQLQVLASTDCLTGLYNRSHFIEETKTYLKFAARNQTPLQLLIVDLDHFKDINDTFGHPAGDQVLKQFADYARSILRETDLIGRVGGEEFCLVLQNTDDIGGDIFAEKLRRGVEALHIEYLNQPISIRVSIGIASLCSGETYQSLSRKADTALYQAKESGRNRVCRLFVGGD